MKLNLLFVLIGLIGLGCVYPLAFRLLPDKRKFLLVAGTVLLHVSVFGLVWANVPTYVIVSFLLLETGVAVLWDPLRLLNESHRRRAVIAGIVCIAASIVISLAQITLFPLWLWVLPIGLYLASVFIPSENRYHYYALILAAALTVGYLGVMGKKAYRLSQTKKETIAVPVIVPPPLNPAPKGVPSSSSAPALKPPALPLTDSMQELDQYIHHLENEKRRLEAELGSLQEELARLKEDVQKKNEKIEELKQISEGL